MIQKIIGPFSFTWTVPKKQQQQQESRHPRTEPTPRARLSLELKISKAYTNFHQIQSFLKGQNEIEGFPG